MSETNRFSHAIGEAALRIWPDLPRDVQERPFDDAVRADDDQARPCRLSP
jgi:hypothetical protein